MSHVAPSSDPAKKVKETKDDLLKKLSDEITELEKKVDSFSPAHDTDTYKMDAIWKYLYPSNSAANSAPDSSKSKTISDPNTTTENIDDWENMKGKTEAEINRRRMSTPSPEIPDYNVTENIDDWEDLHINYSPPRKSVTEKAKDKKDELVSKAKGNVGWAKEKTEEVIDKAESKVKGNVGWAKEKTGEYVDKAESKVKGNVGWAKEKTGEVIDKVENKVKDNIDWAKEKTEEVIDKVESKVKDNVGWAKEKTGEVIDKVENKVKDNVGWAKEKTGEYKGKTEEVIDKVESKVKDNVGWAKEKTGEYVDKIEGMVREKPGDMVKGKANEVAGKVEKAAKDTKEKLKEKKREIEEAFVQLPELNEHENFDDWENLRVKYNISRQNVAKKTGKLKKKDILSDEKVAKTVVVAVDATEGSFFAFKQALLNSHPDDKIQVIHGEHGEMNIDADSKAYGQFSNRELFRKLSDECRAQNRECTFEAKSYMGGTSSLSKKICEHALENEADTIFIGTRGLSGPRKFFMGSVSGSLVQNCPCSVNVIKAPNDPLDQ